MNAAPDHAPEATHRLRGLKSIMSTMQMKPYSTAIGSRPRWPVGALLGLAFRRITAVLALWRSRAAARRTLRALRYIDDRLLADIGLTRGDLSSRRETSFFGGEGFIAEPRASSLAASTRRSAMRERWRFRTLLAEQQKGRTTPYCITLRSRTDATIIGWYGGRNTHWSTDHKWKKRFDKRGDAVAVCHELRNLCPRNASIINIELAQDDL